MMADARNEPEPVEQGRLSGFLTKAASFFRQDRDAATIARLTMELTAKDALIREQEQALAHSRKIIERSSAAARIGVWECSLPDETLTWTDVVYDIFDLPRGSALNRTEVLTCYCPTVVEELNARRARAIRERSGFTMDAEILTALGNRRWVRLTATVECEDDIPIRIFGMKQDITEEKIMLDRTRYLAEFDPLSGLANRSRFQTVLADFCDRHVEPRSLAALYMIDLDGFKAVNDTFGHAAGDDCLQEIARRLTVICGGAILIARLGGDEFAVLVGPRTESRMIDELAIAIVRDISRPVDLGDRTATLGGSVGIALSDGSSPSELFRKADAALYAAKAAGRNTFRRFAPDQPQGATSPRSAA